MKPVLRTRPYRAGDESLFTPREDMASQPWDWSSGAPGPTWTLYDLKTGQVFGLGGVSWVSGYAEAWSVLADMPRRVWPQVLFLAARVLIQIDRVHDRPVIRASARAGFEGGLRCLMRLGFLPTGDLDIHPLTGAPHLVMRRMRTI